MKGRTVKHISNRALIAGAIELKGDDDDPVAGVTKALDTLSKTVDDRLKAVETKATDPALIARLDAIEAKQNRPGSIENKDEAAAEEVKNFGIYLRRGDKAPDLDVKTLVVSSDPQGGYLAPPEFSGEFIKDLVDFSPIRSIASVRQTSNPSVIYPVRIGRTNAKWKGETETQEGSEPSFGEAEVPVKEINTFVDVSNMLLADSGGAAEREVREALAEDFGAKEGAAFVVGNGVKMPSGFLVDARVAQTFSGVADGFNADSLIRALYALPAAYRRNATWVMNSTTLATIRMLKDGTGNYIWQPGLKAGQPETILGRPVVDAVDMPDVAAGTTPIAVGDFQSGYRIVDRIELSILVNPYLRATDGITRFHATRRTGGGVIRPAALRKLKIAVS